MTERKENGVRFLRRSQSPGNGNQRGSDGLKPAKSIRQYFSSKAEQRRQADATWETKGDEDLIGDVKGKFGLKRIFWKGSLDSQGFPTASSIEVKDIFRHCIRVSYAAVLHAMEFRFRFPFFNHVLSVFMVGLVPSLLVLCFVVHTALSLVPKFSQD